MVVLSQCWYSSSAGDGSLVSIGVAQSASKARYGSAFFTMPFSWLDLSSNRWWQIFMLR